MRMYRKHVIASLAGYRVLNERPGMQRRQPTGAPIAKDGIPFYMVYSPSGERIRYCYNVGEAWYVAWRHLQGASDADLMTIGAP